MSDFNNLKKQLEAIGGVANNIKLFQGVNGRGLYPEDSKKEVELKVPHELLAKVDWVEISDNGELQLNASCPWSEKQRKFFLDYQKCYGWNSNLREDISNHVLEFRKLPIKVKNILKQLNGQNFLYREEADVSISQCFQYYLNSRVVNISGEKFLMPLFELLNHSFSANKDWIIKDCVRIKGIFNDEVMINYNNRDDALHLLCSYGFSQAPNYVYSGFLNIRSSSNNMIYIGRFINERNVINGIYEPKVIDNIEGLKITFLQLFDDLHSNLPIEIFSKIMKKHGVDAKQSQILFDGIKAENRKLYIQLLLELEEHQGSVVNSIKRMACMQLMKLA